MKGISLLTWVLGLVLAPLLFGIINKTKALFAGRRGQPWLQMYFDLWKLSRKNVVYSRTTTWVFRAAPLIGLAALFLVSVLTPLGRLRAPLNFSGDLTLFAYFLGLQRFWMVLAGLDAGSSFTGMGASREVWFSALAEPVFFLGLAVVARQTQTLSLTGMLAGDSWHFGPAGVLVALSWFVVLLTENARMPVDDPDTHLELTMIHEVLILDYSGPDLGMILYASALKFWLLGALLVGLLLPGYAGSPGWTLVLNLAGMGALAVIVGILESTMARLRLVRVPHLLIGAGVLSALALILVLR